MSEEKNKSSSNAPLRKVMAPIPSTALYIFDRLDDLYGDVKMS